MTAQEIRTAFLHFFETKGHTIVPSAPMVIKNDPTLLFTNAGMNQFKDIFLGNSPATHKRIANTQKCLRVSGKHNDLEEVGVDTYHHTMFEMLGNWSFGDYFKQEAIDWAWELLTEIYKLDKSRLYATVFEGSTEDKLEMDTEAFELWKKHLPENHILKGNKKDNFWEMGDTGPCGPCSEIHIDIRSETEREKIPGSTLVNAGHPQVVEIWNLVFMQFNRMANGSLQELPARHVDTGMGFERLCMALQGKTSNYDTDVFMPTIQEMEKLCALKYSFSDSKQDIAFRVVADHLRAIAFAIADGQIPSNTGAGYVIRRILRRAVRYGYSFLGRKEPFLFHLLPTFIHQLHSVFPELKKQETLIGKVLFEEEESFLRTLEQGISRFEKMVAEQKNKLVFSGENAFELYDTFGFPIDLTQLLAREKNSEVDMPAFEKCLQQQKDRSKAAAKTEAGDWVILREAVQTVFSGYDKTTETIHICRYRKVHSKGKDFYQLVFDVTPFYPEGGGQVGDSGYLQSENEKILITDTRKENNLILHITENLPQVCETSFTATVDAARRNETAKNHSATHLLHFALRKVLGTHVEQKGSLVNDAYLRFDFSHFSKLTDAEIASVEKMVNDFIAEALPLEEHREIPIQDAQQMGAMMLFGEKYGEHVRAIRFGPSIELCGGIHVPNTYRIGRFKIVSEGSVAAGIRRIEALTGAAADKTLQDKLNTLDAVSALLKNPKDVVKSVQQLLEENKKWQDEVASFIREKAANTKEEIKKQLNKNENMHWYIGKCSLNDAAALKDISFQLLKEYNQLFLVLGTETNNKPMITIVVSEDLAKNTGLHAGNLVKELAKEIKGGGGGQAFYATAGGNDINGLKNVFEIAKKYV